MNKKRSNKILIEINLRKRKITFLLFFIISLLLTSAVCIYTSLKASQNYYVHYDEKSNLDYNVYLKPNDYFGDHLGKDQQYIASLIDHIKANFNYELKIDENINYSYYYFIDATVSVVDTNGKTLYQKTDEIMPKKTFEDDGTHSFKINEEANLDYNYYNNLVSTFLKKYNLNYATSNVTLKMYVGIEGNCENFSSSLEDDAVISMIIPLSTQTVGIDMNYTLSSGTDKLLECQNISIINQYTFITGIIIGFLDLLLITYLLIYVIKTRSAETIYTHTLKSIFSNYGRYISKIKSEISYKKFQIVFVEEFEDLFEVRNSSQSPILFFEEEKKFKSAFIVPTNSGLAYVYYLNANVEDQNE